jgi:UDP-N-acetylmuramoyl-L-alanyl-D-glutamate--2,6-diaminopimelate ligase
MLRLYTIIFEMTFPHLLDGAEVLSQSGDAEISGVEYDSRRIQPGNCFVAMRGETTDGNRYIDAAIANGAAAVVTDSAQEKPRPGVAWAQVAHGRRALARLSANFYGRPAEKLRITGITGTNGKTTTSYLLESILHAAGRQSALVGTVEYHVAGKVLAAPHTTPEPLELERIFSQALGAGATEAVMEVSSHALEQQRVFGIPFDVAVFTNLTRDHLDYHQTMERYFDSKSILFRGCGTEPPRVSVVNTEDDYGAELARSSQSEMRITYGIASGDFHAEKVDTGRNGTRFDVVTPDRKLPIWSPLVGRVNVYNILAAAAAAYGRECSAEAMEKGIAALTHVPGRFQRVDCGQGFYVVVDYAHTDDALRNLTALARALVAKDRGRVITVFGCGGDRDRAKRPLMGEAAGRGSDFAVVTSDNPRSEDPLAIINDVLPGVQRANVRYTMEPDRRKAIALALDEAHPGDIVLIAGKGHEKVQITRQGPAPFDDVEVAREALRSLGYEPCRAAVSGKAAR